MIGIEHMNVILHLGLAKTGTTFLQMWLYLNRPALAEVNLGAFDPLVSHRIAVECLDDPVTENRMDVADIKSCMPLENALRKVKFSGNVQPDTGQCILSSEYFSVVHPPTARSLLDHWKVHVVQIILYLRRQDLYAAAGYTQDVAALGQQQPFVEIKNPPYGVRLDWARMYWNWRNSFPEVTFVVRNYEKYRSGTLLLADFRKWIGCPVEVGSTIPGRANESLNSEMTEFARMLNVRSQPVSRTRLLSLQQTRGGAPYGFSQKLTMAFEDNYRRSNAELASEFPGELGDLADSNWKPAGVDMTGLIPWARFDELCRATLDQQGPDHD
jgi:hypothetical protein